MIKEEGSFTIEATFLFPVIFMIIVLFLFFSLMMYEQVYLHYIATLAAERNAHHWNNSTRDPLTSREGDGEQDPLYWRLTEENLLGSILGANRQTVTVDINQTITSSLVEKKLSSIASKIPQGISGNVSFNNQLVERTIIVQLESRLKLPRYVSDLLGDKIIVRSTSTITEPAEFIRTVDFVKDYTTWLSENRDKAKGILSKKR